MPCHQALSVYIDRICDSFYLCFTFVGMFIASLAMLSAAILDKERFYEPTMVINKISKYSVTGRKVTIFAQVAQFGLMGISEIFVMITGDYTNDFSSR